jgi:hypothetical protein
MNRLCSLGVLVAFVSACSPAPNQAPQSSAPPAAAPTPQAQKTGPVAPPTTDADKIASAKSAAPEAISGAATILDVSVQPPKELQKGTNGWTCLPDLPTSPGADPMCLDKNGFEWVQALLAKKDPPAGKLGFAYMLVGGSDASNSDPFATKPSEGGHWVETGPHVMVLNVGDKFAGYPTTHDNTKAPYVMFPNTPYAHLMIPVK